ncbi:OmpP1/FadL family transporter [candidate division KSB1 bacterium]
MNKLYKNVLFCFCLIVLVHSPLFSQSLFSTLGLGKLNYFLNTRSAGMGNVGLAFSNNLTYNRMNPATSSGLKETSFNAGFVFEGMRVARTENSFNASLSRMNGASLSVKLLDGLVITGGLFPVSIYEYEFFSTEESDDYKMGITGNGGLSAGEIGIAYKVLENLSVGLSASRLFGRLEEKTIINFYDGSFIDTEDNIEKYLTGNSFKAGVLYSINNKINVGGFFTKGYKLSGEVEYGHIYVTDEVDKEDINYYMPYSYGIGGMYQLNPKLMLGADLSIFKGSRLKNNGFTMDVVQDAFTFSAGGEYTPSKNLYDSFFSRMSYRAGFYVHTPYLRDADLSSIREYFLTGGLGFPFNDNNARIDFALEVGMRGSKENDLASEKIARFTVSFSSNEKWFSREKK